MPYPIHHRYHPYLADVGHQTFHHARCMVHKIYVDVLLDYWGCPAGMVTMQSYQQI